MKQSEFLELLNLYLDHEITAVDAARLEGAVAADPARRKIYEEYCRMHKACSLVAMDFRSADGTVVAAVDKVVPFDFAATQAAARRRRMIGYLNGGLAAAACLAVAFVGFRVFSVSSPAEGELATNDVVAARSPGVAVATSAVPNAAAGGAAPSSARELGGSVHARVANTEALPAPKWVSAPLVLSASSSATGMTAALRQADDQLAWIQSVQFTPIQSRVQLEQIRFDAQPASLQPEGRALGGRIMPLTEPAAEMAAFRFVK
jgi:hypothetical protein